MTKPFIPLCLSDQSRRLERRAARQNLTGETLMETAGRLSARRITELFPRSPFAVFCGPGNNGGDGWVSARHLKEAGGAVTVFFAESRSALFRKNRDAALKSGVKSAPLETALSADLKGKVLVDALFGLGLSRPLEGLFSKIVSVINNAEGSAVSLDIPSGLCGDTGQISGKAVKADHTFAFGLGKPGFYLQKGPGLVGKVETLNIGFPEELLNEVCDTCFLVEKTSVPLPVYEDCANKSHRGHTLICAGRKGFWGSGILACRGAFIAGSGYVTWASEDLPDIIKIPEVLTVNIKDLNILKNKTAVAIGPGTGFGPHITDLIRRLRERERPVLLDADALTLLSQNPSLLPLKPWFVLTPHSGELSRILKIPSKEIEKDRLRFARQGAKKTGGLLVLKGFHTVLSDGVKHWIVNAGNSALGKAGTGDVLTGLTAGFLAQGLEVRDSALLAVTAHGETAERWLKEGKDINSFSAGDVLNLLPSVLFEIRKNAC